MFVWSPLKLWALFPCVCLTGALGRSLHVAACPLVGGALPLPLKPPCQPTPSLEGTPSLS